MSRASAVSSGVEDHHVGGSEAAGPLVRALGGAAW